MILAYLNADGFENECLVEGRKEREREGGGGVTEAKSPSPFRVSERDGGF